MLIVIVIKIIKLVMVIVDVIVMFQYGIVIVFGKYKV